MKNEIFQRENDTRKRDRKSGLNSLEESNPQPRKTSPIPFKSIDNNRFTPNLID